MSEDIEKDFLVQEGYKCVTRMPTGHMAAIKMINQQRVGICTGFDSVGHDNIWFYNTLREAESALLAWDGRGDPEGYFKKSVNSPHPRKKLKVDQMWAFVVMDDDGDEGVPAVKMNGNFYPLVGADMARAKSVREQAVEVSNGTGRPVELRRFTTMEVIETIHPEDEQ